MKVSVIIPTYNRLESLTRCLSTVLEQDFPADSYEVIVVVDGSTDGSIDYLHSLSPRCSLKVVEQQNRGPAAARNRGVGEATGDLILLLDDDNIVDPSLARRHVEAHGSEVRDVVFGPVLLAAESSMGLATDLMRKSSEDYLARLIEQNGPCSAFEVWVYSNCSMPRHVFVDSGGYDETIPFPGEDGDFAIRCWQKGVSFRFRPEIVTYQKYSKSIDELIRDYGTRSAQAEIVLCRKHPEYRAHSPLMLWIGGSRVKRCSAMIVSSAPRLSLSMLRGISRFLERVRPIPLVKSLGVRVLSAAISAERVAAAVSLAGSLSGLRGQLGLSKSG